MNSQLTRTSGSYPGFFAQTTPSERSGTQLYFQPGLSLRPLPRSALEVDGAPTTATGPTLAVRPPRRRAELVAVGLAATSALVLIVWSWLRLWWLA